jgi:hypothetical protein
MTRDVFMLRKGDGPTITIAGTRDALLMEAYVSAKCGAEITARELEAMSEYAEDRKAAIAWLEVLGIVAVPAKLKWEEGA